MKLSIRKTVLVLATLLPICMSPSAVLAGDQPFLGEMQWVGFNFAPRGWAKCDGQLLPINQYQSLYSLLGTTYGGDGRTTFALPDMRGRTPAHVGTTLRLGQKIGQERVTLTASQMPTHTHQMRASSDNATTSTPVNNQLGSTGRTRIYDPPPSDVSMSTSAITSTGGGQAHENMPPFTTLNCIIALQGLFPSRN